MATSYTNLANTGNTVFSNVTGLTGLTSKIRRLASLAQVIGGTFLTITAAGAGWNTGVSYSVPLISYNQAAPDNMTVQTNAAPSTTNNTGGTFDIADIVVFQTGIGFPQLTATTITSTAPIPEVGSPGEANALTFQWYYHTSITDYTQGTIITGQTSSSLNWTSTSTFLAAVAASTHKIGWITCKVTDTVTGAVYTCLSSIKGTAGQVFGAASATGAYAPIVPVPVVNPAIGTLTTTAAGINFPGSTIHIEQVGTSITANTLSELATYLTTISGGSTALFSSFNGGSSGSTIALWLSGVSTRFSNLITRIQAAQTAGKTVYIFLELGINDVGSAGRTEAATLADFTTFCDQVHAAVSNVRIIVNGPTYRCDSNTLTNVTLSFNAALEAWATTRAAGNPLDYVGTFKQQRHFAHEAGTHLTTDGLHPDTEGGKDKLRLELEAAMSVWLTVYGPSQVATPTFSPVAGTYTSVQSVTPSTVTSGATLYYTTNGIDPTISDTQVTGAISVGATQTLKVLAVKSGLTNSAIASAAYTINLPVIPGPPTNLTKTATAGVITIGWTASTNVPTGYVIERQVAGVWTTINSNYTGGTSFADSGYTGAFPTAYRVSGKNAAGTGTAATISTSGSGSGGDDVAGYTFEAVTPTNGVDLPSGVCVGLKRNIASLLVIQTEDGEYQRHIVGPTPLMVRTIRVLANHPTYPADNAWKTETGTDTYALYPAPE